MKFGTVSVVVPVYNAEKYLDRCIGSLVSQTYKDLEIILVDDGSADNSPAMCDAWAQNDARIRVIHKENAGAGMARNAAMDVSTGDIMCFVDSDDYVSPELVSKAVGALTENGADIVLFGKSNVSPSGEVSSVFVPASPKNVYSGSEVASQLLPALIYNNKKDSEIRNLPLSLWSCAVTTETVKRAGWRLLSERDVFSEDSYGLIALYRHVRRAVILNEALYFYCENEASLSHDYRNRRFDMIKGFRARAFELAGIYENPEPVRERICDLYMSFLIGSMKQLVLSDMRLSDKLRFIRRIISDPATRDSIDAAGLNDSGRARNILYYIMRKGCVSLVYLLVKLQTARRR